MQTGERSGKSPARRNGTVEQSERTHFSETALIAVGNLAFAINRNRLHTNGDRDLTFEGVETAGGLIGKRPYWQDSSGVFLRA